MLERKAFVAVVLTAISIAAATIAADREAPAAGPGWLTPHVRLAHIEFLARIPFAGGLRFCGGSRVLVLR